LEADQEMIARATERASGEKNYALGHDLAVRLVQSFLTPRYNGKSGRVMRAMPLDDMVEARYGGVRRRGELHIKGEDGKSAIYIFLPNGQFVEVRELSKKPYKYAVTSYTVDDKLNRVSGYTTPPSDKQHVVLKEAAERAEQMRRVLSALR